MDRIKILLPLVVLAFLGWIVLFQGTQPVQSSALPGITGFTATPTHEPTKPPLPPTVTKTQVIHTLPPPPTQPVTPDSPLIIPVTGTVKTANLDGVLNIGLVIVAFGLIAAGVSLRKNKK